MGRSPDTSGANYWLSEFTNGDASLTEIENAFGASAEFQARYSGLTNTAFVTEVYNNVLGRGPDSEGLTYWTGLLDTGDSTRTEVVGFISASDEFVARTPYALSPFCTFIDTHAGSYSKTQVAPDTVWMRSADGNVNVLYIDKNTSGALRVSPGTSLRRPGHYGGTAAINGNWYNHGSDFFAGYSIANSVVRGAINNDGRLGFIGDDTASILRIGHYQDISGAVPTNAWNMLSGKTLVVASAPWGPTTTTSTDPTFTNRNPRTAVGTTPEGYLIWAVIDGRRYGPGMTGTETANLLVSLGAHRGLMLDGGGSSAMYVDGHGIVNQPSDGTTRSVGNQLIFDARADWVE